jgi:hypothetical protein
MHSAISPPSAPSGARRTRRFCTALAGSAALLSAPFALGHTIDFDQTAATLLLEGDALALNGLRLTALATPGTGSGGFLGAVLDSTDYNACSNMACPVNGSGNYYAAVNDGSVLLNTMQSGATFHLTGFDASFIGSDWNATYPGLAGTLLLVGRDSSGATMQEMVGLAGPGYYGFEFSRYTTSAAFASHAFTSVTLSGFSCDDGFSCSSFSNKAQFALDNLAVSAVPEPATSALLLSGLAAVVWMARRRSLPLTGRTA